MATYIPAILRDNKFQQAEAGDKLLPSQIPVSAGSGNLAEVRPDGVYVGSSLPDATYYVASSGTDDTSSGSKATPFKTLDYALQRLSVIAGNLVGFSASIALKSGESFVLTQRHTLTGNFLLSFYGDILYGDFNDPLQPVNGEFCQALIRPVIVINSLPGAATKVSGFDTNYTIEFRGVQINLPLNPSGAGNSDYSTYDVVLGDTPRLLLTGTYVNKLSIMAYAGILGITARCRASLSQYASQFLVNGLKVDGSSVPGLPIRPHFIHFYADQRVNASPFLFASSVNSNSGFGLLALNWTDTQAQNIGANVVVETFPTIPDVNYGLRNYFFNLQRDQQSRPLNIQSARLF